MKNKSKFIIGIDEAGRGPLAGPVAIGLVLVPVNFDWNLIPGVNDSKKLSEMKREVIYERALELARVGKLQYVVEMPTAKAIDKKGIAVVIKGAIANGLTKLLHRQDLCKNCKSTRSCLLLQNKLGNEQTLKSGSKRQDLLLDPGSVMVKLDGGLKAPSEWIHQETIIKGDAKERVIGLASIMAKVTRDRYMEKLARKPQYAQYNFAQHKGYGTLAHRTAISEYGLSREHRASFCKNISFQ